MALPEGRGRFPGPLAGGYGVLSGQIPAVVGGATQRITIDVFTDFMIEKISVAGVVSGTDVTLDIAHTLTAPAGTRFVALAKFTNRLVNALSITTANVLGAGIIFGPSASDAGISLNVNPIAFATGASRLVVKNNVIVVEIDSVATGTFTASRVDIWGYFVNSHIQDDKAND